MCVPIMYWICLRRQPVVALTSARPLVAAGTDTTLRIWEPLAGTCLQVVKAHSSEVSAMVWMPDGLSIITGSHDRHLVRCERSMRAESSSRPYFSCRR